MMMQKYSPDIPPRHLHFRLEKTSSKFWHGNSDVKTYHFNALATFLPTLEKLVVLSLKKALTEIHEPILKSQVSSLVAQEAIHGREFLVYNKQLIFQHYHIPPHTQNIALFRKLAGFLNKFSHTFHYALSAAGEHFTAITASLFLQDPKWFQGVAPHLSAIWRWHCIEEIEHKTVAFDVFQSLNGNYLLRVLGMLMMTGVFISVLIKPIWHMMKQDKKHKDLKFYLRCLQYYFGKGGLCWALFKPYLDYFAPSFHPSQHKNEALISHWKAFLQVTAPSDIVKGLQSVTPPKI